MTKGVRQYIDPSDYEATIAQWRGARAKIWQYHPSLARMAVQLYRPHENEQLYVIAVGCRYIRGPFSWEANHLQIAKTQDGEHESTYIIRDDSAGFALQCAGGIVVIRSTMDFDLYADQRDDEEDSDTPEDEPEDDQR